MDIPTSQLDPSTDSGIPSFETSSGRSTIFTSRPPTWIKSTSSTVCKVIATFYESVVLLPCYLVYSRSLENIRHSGTHGSRADTASTFTKVIQLMDDVKNNCHGNSVISASGFCWAIYVIQNSSEALPLAWGWVLLIKSLEGASCSFIIYSFVRLAKGNDNSVCFVDSAKSAQDRAAKIFAVPLSSMLWCLVVMTVCTAFYSTQSNADQLPSPIQHSRKTHAHTSATWGAQPMPPTAGALHRLSTASVVCLGCFASLAVLRVFYVLVSIARIMSIKAEPELLLEDGLASALTATGLSRQQKRTSALDDRPVSPVTLEHAGATLR